MIGFGKFGKRGKTGIYSLKDERLKFINPGEYGFFDKVLAYDVKNARINDFINIVEIKCFIEAVREVQNAELTAFWAPIYAPSLEGDKVFFEIGKPPAFNHPFNFWKEKAEEMPAVEGRKWIVGSEYRYYAFLVHLFNKMLKNGWEIDKAMKTVAINSEELEYFLHSNPSKTGSKETCGFYDLLNCRKFLTCTNKDVGGFWLGSGSYYRNHYPLANLEHSTEWGKGELSADEGVDDVLGWLIIPM